MAVIGGSGLVGSQLVRRLVAEGHAVSSLSRSGRPQGHEPWLDQVDWHATALGTEESLDVCAGADWIFHLASTTIPSTSNQNILLDAESNILPTLRMLERLRGGNARVVFASSGGTVYGRPQTDAIAEDHPTNPISAYGIHKLALEKYFFLYRDVYGVSSAIVRPANIYGEAQNMAKPLGALGHFARRVYDREPIEIWGDGSAVRDYVHVDDVVDILIRTAAYGGEPHVFNAGSGVGVSLLDIVAALDRITGRKNEVKFLPGRSFDVPVNVLDSTLAARELGWTAQVDLATGLQRMLSSFA